MGITKPVEPPINNIYTVVSSGIGHETGEIGRGMWLAGQDITDADLAGLDKERLLALGAIVPKTEVTPVMAGDVASRRTSSDPDGVGAKEVKPWQ